MKKTTPNWGKIMFPLLFFVTVAILLMLPFMRSGAANPTLTNADFETGPFDQGTTVTGWTVTGHAGDVTYAGGSNGSAHAAALSPGGDTTGDAIAQGFTTTSGTSYHVDFDSGIFGQPSGGPLQVEVQIIGNGTLVDQTITPPSNNTFGPTTFSHFTIPFTANSASTTLKFISVGSGNANADQIIDSVSVTMTSNGGTPTPTPTPTATPANGTTSCNAQGAVADACYQIRPPPCTSGQAFWFPNADCNIPEGTDCVNPQSNPSTGTDGFKYIFAVGTGNPSPSPGTFTENTNDGTANLTGHLESTLHPGYGFDVNVTWTGRTNNANAAGCNGPLLELDHGCYTAPFGTGGPVNPATWHFYQGVSNATLTGTGNYAGAVVQLIPVMHCFQVGVGASGKNVLQGMSGWFTWNVLHQPTNPSFCIRSAAQVNRTADFNLNCTTCTGQIGDFVWNDTNHNGCQDAGEPGIPNVQVQLFAGCNTGGQALQTTHTDNTGHYLFTGLCAGTYTVSFTTPTGFAHTLANQACNVGGQPSDSTDSDCNCTGTTSPCGVCVTLPNDNSSDLTIDCGYIQTCTGQIGDFVWQDDNHNGCQDAGEPGIPNVQVQLFAGCNTGGQALQTTHTDNTGHYLFTGLCAGTYTVSFTTPTGFTHTVANAACNVGGQPSDSTDSDCDCTGTTSPCGVCVTLPTDNSSDLTIDCGYIPPCSGTIGDFVWNDTNQNGCQDAGEPGIPGVQVQLFAGCNTGGQALQTTHTDNTGHYLFTGLCAGTYTVSFTTPSGFTHTIANAACNVGGQPSDSTDSDCTCTGDTSPCGVCVTLPLNNSSDLTIDCGYIPSCPACVNPNLGGGAGTAFSVFQLGGGSVSITGPAGGIVGDLAVGPNGKLSMSGDEFVTGTIKLGPGATFSNSAHFTPTVQTNVDLTAAINAAKNLSTSSAALPCDQNFAKVDGQTVTNINAMHAGVNVICIKDVTLSGKQVHLNNPSNFANVTFVLNVTGQFTLTGGGAGPQIRAGTNVKPADILYNLLGTTTVAFSGGGGGTNCCVAIVDGTLLAVNRDINLAPGLVNGELIGGKNISIVSGSAIKCPPCTH